MPPADDNYPLTTGSLQKWVVELRAGRPDAAAPVFTRIDREVRRLAASQFRKFPRVGRFAELDDVISGAMLRMLNGLKTIRPASTREFYALSNVWIRRELLDLIKRFYGPAGSGTRLTGVPVGDGDGEVNPADTGWDAELDRMTAFHEAVAALEPVEWREAFCLRYYHNWSQDEVAGLFGVSTKTVGTWQVNAKQALRGLLEEEE